MPRTDSRRKCWLVQAQAYRQQYGFNAITLLPVNLYGPGDNFDLETSHVIPALIRKAIEARDAGDSQMQVWGTGSASREFLFAADAAEGIALAAAHYDKPEPVNIGSGMEISIRELAELICNLCGFQGKLVWDASNPMANRGVAWTSAAPNRNLASPRKPVFRDGLIETIAWYEKHRTESDATKTKAVETQTSTGN